MVTMMRETVGREALIALSNQYESVADALMEIIDNPFDYRRGRRLGIDISVAKKRAGRIEVLDRGGEGMDDAGLADWIAWGTGHAHAESDIGQYHVGGKLAAIYLANSIEIICRKSGQPEIWRFEDAVWGTRKKLLDDVAPEKIDPRGLSAPIRDIPADQGFTLIVLSRLKDHRFEEGILRVRLANTYRTLLQRRDCEITLNGQSVAPLELPESTTYAPVDMPLTTAYSGVRVRGRFWVMDRDRFEDARGFRLKAGVRTVFNGRLITDGEEFGHYLAGRGALQRLMGEVDHGRKAQPDQRRLGQIVAGLVRYYRRDTQPPAAARG